MIQQQVAPARPSLIDSGRHFFSASYATNDGLHIVVASIERIGRPERRSAGRCSLWDAAFVAYREAEIESKVAGTPAGAKLIPGMAGDYLDCLTAFSGAARRVVDKMPVNFLYVGLIHAESAGRCRNYEKFVGPLHSLVNPAAHR